MDNKQLAIKTLTSAIVIFIIVKIRQYLEELSNCGCTSPSFNRIRFLELLVIGLIVIQYFTKPMAPKPNLRVMGAPLILKIVLPIAIILYLYLAYNTVQFSKDANSNETCKKCTNKWEKYALYVQAFMYGLSAALLIISSAILINYGVVNINSAYGYGLAGAVVFLLGLAGTTIFGGSINDLIDIVEKNTVNEGFCGCGANKEEKKLL